MKIAKKQIIDNDPNFDLMWQWNKKGELTLNQDDKTVSHLNVRARLVDSR